MSFFKSEDKQEKDEKELQKLREERRNETINRGYYIPPGTEGIYDDDDDF